MIGRISIRGERRRTASWLGERISVTVCEAIDRADPADQDEADHRFQKRNRRARVTGPDRRAHARVSVTARPDFGLPRPTHTPAPLAKPCPSREDAEGPAPAA